MAQQKTILDQTVSQLKEACKASHSHWIVWMELTDTGWKFSQECGITPPRRRALNDFINKEKTSIWLAGALSSGRVRSRKTSPEAIELGCQHVYAFPCQISHRILVVGADGLDTYAENLLRILAMQPLPMPPPETLDKTDIPLWLQEPGFDAPYNTQHTFDRILEYLTRRIPCSHSFLAIRSGETFYIKATWESSPGKAKTELSGYELHIQGDEILSHLVTTHRGLIIHHRQETSTQLQRVMSPTAGSWMIVPILIGQRVIGIIAFSSNESDSYHATDLNQIAGHIKWLAYSIENAITFIEVTRYLEQLALLNELASMASLGIEPISATSQDEFARRVLVWLERIFKTDWAAILLLSNDGQKLDEVGRETISPTAWSDSIRDNVIHLVVRTGQPVRVDDLRVTHPELMITFEFRSLLAVPLKYRGRVIGAIALVSNKSAAFTQTDEQLLVLIASHMAGFFENLRLNEETRERAQRLSDSVRQLQAVRDTSLDIAGDLDLDTLLKRVTHRARDLIGARGAELGLYTAQEQVVEIVVSETPWENVQGTRIPLMAGVAGRMAAFGEPIIVNDYNQWQGRLYHERVEAFHAVAGVPLKFRGEVIGTLSVLDDRPEKQFTSADIHMLELLAPQAAISIRNARLYQELESRIKAQQVAESRLIRSARLAAVGEMAAGVAHELNNPLTTVTGFVELAIGDLPPGSQQRKDLELVLEEALRARGVVRRLLDFSRPAEDQRTRTDLSELILQVLPLVDHLARTSGVTITTILGKDLPWIPVDANQIKQVLLNLIHNGLQSMPSGGNLTISSIIETRELAGTKTDFMAIRIQDNGEGILPENIERIFEPFFSTRPAGKGTGLGLSVSYGIVTSHGGWIEVDSTPHEGSCFTVYLPLTEEFL